MRTRLLQSVLAVSGIFAAGSCQSDDTRRAAPAATGGVPAGSAGTDASGSAGAAGSSTGGAAAGTSGAFDASGGSASSGAPNPGGAPGAGGALSHAGAAGRTASAGTSGAAPSDGGAANPAGAPGAGGEGATAGEGGASHQAGTAGNNTAGTGGAVAEPVGLSWPIDCIPGETCVGLGYPDTDEDGDAHDCGEPGYFGHQGTDIDISAEAQAAGTAVRAAADGVVVFAFDGKYDQCPDANEPDCRDPPSAEPGSTAGTTVCTPLGPYCGTGQEGCFWCFSGGNVLVIRHTDVPGVFATRYDHLKKDSVLVRPGENVSRGQKLAEAGSSGNSTRPHLHFEVWGSGFYELADPWAGPCGPNTGPSLWAYDPPWSRGPILHK